MTLSSCQVCFALPSYAPVCLVALCLRLLLLPSAHANARQPGLLLQFKAYKIVYRRYAGLFFSMCVDVADNELMALEAIHLFVEVLDHYFENVCELDLVFNFHKVRLLLNWRAWLLSQAEPFSACCIALPPTHCPLYAATAHRSSTQGGCSTGSRVHVAVARTFEYHMVSDALLNCRRTAHNTCRRQRHPLQRVSIRVTPARRLQT